MIDQPNFFATSVMNDIPKRIFWTMIRKSK